MRTLPPVQPMPSLGWAETIDTVHMWAQVMGKIKLAQMPSSTTGGTFRCTSLPLA